ncbi:cell division protein FtsQ/DivIB [Corynebacterium hindlerae]|uniref:cell division protein FtsQ/DivIB n=1 Tax=Corynebacterium hindlerae TaxID=699041 RepID=UPI0031B69066
MKVALSRKVIFGGVGAAVLLAVVAAAVLLFVPTFQVSRIDVTGNSETAAEDVESASGIALGVPLVRLNLQQAAEGVAQLPWVAKVNVERDFPSTARIVVEERQAVLFARRNDGEHLVDATGRPFVIQTPPSGCVEVTGTKEDDPALFADVVTAVTALDPGARGQLERVDAPSKFELKLFFAGGKEVYWGSTEHAHDKAKATSTVLQREGQRWNVSAPGLVTLIP